MRIDELILYVISLIESKKYNSYMIATIAENLVTNPTKIGTVNKIILNIQLNTSKEIFIHKKESTLFPPTVLTEIVIFL